MKRVFIDMDGVVVNFEKKKQQLGITGDEMKKMPGVYQQLEPYPEALAAIKYFIGSGYDVFLATKPPTGIAHAYGDKAQWVFDHLPELKRKIIITHDKGLLGGIGDFLIDDRPHKANCREFQGCLIEFTNGMNWDKAIQIVDQVTEVIHKKGYITIPCKYCSEITSNFFSKTCNKPECQEKRKAQADLEDRKQNLWNVKKK